MEMTHPTYPNCQQYVITEGRTLGAITHEVQAFGHRLSGERVPSCS